jgi:hypothetical protein
MSTTIICKNCNNHFKGNFCNNCGQASHTHKLSFHYIWHDLQHGLFHFDNGIFYTIKQLLTKPGHTIREFIQGKRVSHFKPFSLIVILATIYGLVFHYLIEVPVHKKTINPRENVVVVYEKILGWSMEHFAYAAFIMIVSTTIASYYVFRKEGYNLAEHLVLNTFYRGLTLIISIILLPIQYILYYKGGIENLKLYAFFSQILDFALMYWCYLQFYNNLKTKELFGRIALTYVVMIMIHVLFAYLAGCIVFYM